ncbi:MAG: hypothetical protein R6X34_17200 [Chloroflexota bacterium]
MQGRPSVVGRGQYSLQLRRVSLGKQGRVSLDEAETFVVDEGVERLPPFATAIPQNEPAFTLVVWDRLLRALRGQEEQVCLSVHSE